MLHVRLKLEFYWCWIRGWRAHTGITIPLCWRGAPQIPGGFGSWAGQLHAGILKGCCCTGSYWRELEHGGCSFRVVPSCPNPRPVNTRPSPARPQDPPHGCISGWCRPLIRRNSSGTGCNEALPGLSRDRDDRGGISMRAAGFPCRRQDFHAEAGSGFGLLFTFSFLPMCRQHRF